MLYKNVQYFLFMSSSENDRIQETYYRGIELPSKISCWFIQEERFYRWKFIRQWLHLSNGSDFCLLHPLTLQIHYTSCFSYYIARTHKQPSLTRLKPKAWICKALILNYDIVCYLWFWNKLNYRQNCDKGKLWLYILTMILTLLLYFLKPFMVGAILVCSSMKSWRKSS